MNNLLNGIAVAVFVTALALGLELAIAGAFWLIDYVRGLRWKWNHK